jgi:hypothetical protein
MLCVNKATKRTAFVAVDFDGSVQYFPLQYHAFKGGLCPLLGI